jgi:hypothetical protein
MRSRQDRCAGSRGCCAPPGAGPGGGRTVKRGSTVEPRGAAGGALGTALGTPLRRRRKGLPGQPRRGLACEPLLRRERSPTRRSVRQRSKCAGWDGRLQRRRRRGPWAQARPRRGGGPRPSGARGLRLYSSTQGGLALEYAGRRVVLTVRRVLETAHATLGVWRAVGGGSAAAYKQTGAARAAACTRCPQRAPVQVQALFLL